MAREHPRADLYRAAREQGMTYQQIAEMYGVSKQTVGQICGKGQPYMFRAVSERCVYPNLRRWMNDNKVSVKELLRRMGKTAYTSTCDSMGSYLRGEHDPPKVIIDAMLKATGMTYEEMFYREDAK